MGPGVRPEGWSAHPLVVLCAVCMHSTLLLLPTPQKWQLGFLVFLYLLSRNCPSCTCTQLFLVPYSFFVFCCLRRGDVCPGASTAGKGSRSQVSGPSLSQFQPTQKKIFNTGIPKCQLLNASMTLKSLLAWCLLPSRIWVKVILVI